MSDGGIPESSLFSVLRRASSILREEGLLVLLSRILGETVYRQLLVLERPLGEPQPLCQAALPTRSRWLGPDEAERYASFDPAVSAAEASRRFARGHSAFVVEVDGRIAHGLWVATSEAWTNYLKLSVPVEPGEAYIYQTYTTPGMRGKGFATAAMSSIAEALRNEGLRRVFCCVQTDRALAYPPPLRSGFVPVAVIGSIRLGPWRWVFRRPTRQLPFVIRRRVRSWVQAPGM